MAHTKFVLAAVFCAVAIAAVYGADPTTPAPKPKPTTPAPKPKPTTPAPKPKPTPAPKPDLEAAAKKHSPDFAAWVIKADKDFFTATAAAQITVFVPTPEAFAAKDKNAATWGAWNNIFYGPKSADMITELLATHKSDKSYTLKELSNLTTVPVGEDGSSSLAVKKDKDGKVELSSPGNGVTVAATESFPAVNGNIVLVDGFLVPEDEKPTETLAQAVDAATSSTLFAKALKKKNVTLLGEDLPLTVFVPTDAAMTAFAKKKNALQNSTVDLDKFDGLKELLENHVVHFGGVESALEADKTLSTYDEGMLLQVKVEKKNTTKGMETVVTVNGATIVGEPTFFSNGVMYSVDGVLDPSGDEPNPSDAGGLSTTVIVAIVAAVVVAIGCIAGLVYNNQKSDDHDEYDTLDA